MRHPEQREDYPIGESRSHACMAMTEPKGRGIAPSSDIARLNWIIRACHPALVAQAQHPSAQQCQRTCSLPQYLPRKFLRDRFYRYHRSRHWGRDDKHSSGKTLLRQRRSKAAKRRPQSVATSECEAALVSRS